MDPEIIDISLEKIGGDDWGSSGKKVNFGSGIELLMNSNARGESKSGSSKNDIDIDDLTNLENELNNLSSSETSAKLFSSGSGVFSSDEKPSVKFSENINIGQATAETSSPDSKTWDGYGKFNNIPINPDVMRESSSLPQLSKEEMLREKFKYLRKLESLEKKGVDLTKKYTMDSPLAEMQGEYEMIMEEKAKQNSVKFQGNMMMAVINGIEFLNNKFDPFDIKLDGWGEQINENINDYDEIFSELHDKYKSKATMAPELKLMFQLGGSAMMVHMTNTMFKSAMPGMDDILRQNPDLMNQFQKAAVNSMSNTNPGFSGFMSGLMNEGPSQGQGPPPPISTQNMQFNNQRAGNNMTMNMNESKNIQMGRNNFTDDGININIKETKRPEMKGPSDMSDILSGLKTKTINIKQQDTDNNSTISISDLKDIQDATAPKKSRRRPTSNKNTISLDI